MNRRMILFGISSTLGTALAGCLDRALGTRNTETAPTDDGEDLATIKSIGLKIDDSGAAPAEYGIELAVNVVRKTATVDHPARISVTLDYRGDEPLTIYSGRGEFALLYNRWGHSEGQSQYGAGRPLLWLLQPQYEIDGENQWGPEVTGCWETVNRMPLPGRSEKVGSRTFEPGETLTEEYNLWATKDSETCFPSGDYVFDQYLSIEPESNPNVRWDVRMTL